MKNVYSADLAVMQPLCTSRWSGSAVETVQVTGQPDAKQRVQEGGNRPAWRLVVRPCLFYKQGERISIDAALPRLFGEDVLSFRLLTNYCVHAGDSKARASFLVSINDARRRHQYCTQAQPL